MKRFAAVLAFSLCSASSFADTPEQILERYAGLAKQEDPAFAGFSAEHGHELYFQKRVLPVVGAINCASCHMADILVTSIVPGKTRHLFSFTTRNSHDTGSPRHLSQPQGQSRVH